MNPENTPTPPAPEPEIIIGFGGRALRLINQNRLLKTGDQLYNKHGQGLWEAVGFHPKGVRVIQWPHGAPADWAWSDVYRFYERAPEKDVPEKPEAAEFKPAS